jgi:hypothetical protein
VEVCDHRKDAYHLAAPPEWDGCTLLLALDAPEVDSARALIGTFINMIA